MTTKQKIPSEPPARTEPAERASIDAPTPAGDDPSANGHHAEPAPPSAGGPTSWTPVDIAPLRAGLAATQPPELLARTDGVMLVYPGKRHAFIGESESLKSWAALLLCAIELKADNWVLFLDFESDEASVIHRLLALGVTWDQLADRFHYVRPSEPLNDRRSRITPGGLDHSERIATTPYRVAIVDGVTEAMALHGLDPLDNLSVAKFSEMLTRPLARSGPAVIEIDHVTKDREGRGRFAIGAQHKLAGLDGASYLFEVFTPFGRGRHGMAKVSVGKDRAGHVRAHEGPGRRIADLHAEADPDGLIVTLELRPPEGSADGAPFRPTVLMERVSHWLEDNHPGGAGAKAIRAGVTGKSMGIDKAVRALIDEGCLDPDTRAIIRPYRNTDGRPEEGSDGR